MALVTPTNTSATSVYANDGQTGGCGGGGGSYGSPTPIPHGAPGPTNRHQVNQHLSHLAL